MKLKKAANVQFGKPEYKKEVATIAQHAEPRNGNGSFGEEKILKVLQVAGGFRKPADESKEMGQVQTFKKLSGQNGRIGAAVCQDDI
jgi:hypothetical protein